MFEFDAGKLLIVGVIALIFIPTKDLPRVLRQVGQFVGKMRRMAADFQGQFMDAMREADMEDIRREAKQLADAARIDVGLDSVHDLDLQMVAKRPTERLGAPLADPAAEPTGIVTADHQASDDHRRDQEGADHGRRAHEAPASSTLPHSA